MSEHRCKIFHKIVNYYLYFPQAQSGCVSSLAQALW